MNKNIMPKVSIVIPVYNGENYLRDAIESAINQTYENCEVIVVNDGSTDGGKTAEIAKSYGKKIIYCEKPNGGVATAVNMGIKMMTGEYFAWLSHDDMFKEDKIEKQIEAIKKSGIKNAICHSNFEFLYVEENKNVKVNWLDQYTIQQLECSCFSPVFLAIHGSTVLIHKSHFERVGYYREDLKATQDSEFLFRAMRGQKSVFVGESLMVSRVHKQQGQQTLKCHKEEYNKMFIDFCEKLSEQEMKMFAGSSTNFYYKLYLNLKNSRPADEVLFYLKKKIKEMNITGERQINQIDSNRHVFIFGAGQIGGEALDLMRSYDIKVDAFLDNDIAKWGNFKCGIEIKNPSFLKEVDNAFVVVSMMDTRQVEEQLYKMNVKNISTLHELKKKLWYNLPKILEV